MIEHRAGSRLTGDEGFSPLFRDWLASDRRAGSATAELQRFMAPAEAGTPAPAWGAEGWRLTWLADLATDLPGAADRERAAASVARLAAGEADVVITGQQPGFLGGPLYTLFKVATAVAAAAARSAAGRPTIALFWAGDDDDDRREAFRPWLWDPRRKAFLRARPPEGPADLMVGAASAASWGMPEAAWLAEQAGRNALAAGLAALWAGAIRDGRSWGRLQRRALLRVFRGSGLLAVSGNDEGLHGLAAPLYDRLLRERSALAGAAARRGEELAADGYHAQIGEGSLARCFNLARDGRRLAMPEEEVAAAAASRLRPGVAARSLVQDWLFRPAGVVVGPGELAYLKQLEPVYALFGVGRSPLLPRLFGALAPVAAAERRLQDERAAAEAVDRAAARVADTARAALIAALADTAGLDRPRAELQAGRLAERWGQAAASLLDRENRRTRERHGAAGPAWLTGPRGRRQERSLASHWAAALWGDDLAPALSRAARAHLDAGRQDAWREFRIVVPEPEEVVP